MNKFLTTLALCPLLHADTIPVLIGSGSNGIYRSDLNRETGGLSEARHVGKAGGAGFLALRPDHKVVVSTTGVDGKGGVVSWKVTAEGVEKINGANYDGKGLCQVSFDHTNQMVMGADYGGGKLAAWTITPDGKLGENSAFFKHEAITSGQKPRVHAAWPGPDNKFAYVPDLGIDRVKIYAMEPATGKLTPAGEGVCPPGSGPRHMKFSKDGNFAYVLNELTLMVTIFKRDAQSGALTELETVSTLKEGANKEDMSCSEIIVSKDGKYVYTGNRDLKSTDRDSVSLLAVQENGSLKHVQSVPSGVWIARNIALTPENNYILVSGQRSHQVTTIKVDTKTGKMTPTGKSISVKAAMCVVFP